MTKSGSKRTNRNEMFETATITLQSTIYRQNLKSTWTLRHILRILQVQVQVQVHLFKLIQLQYNNKEKKGRSKKQS